jgi:hypothetical protein
MIIIRQVRGIKIKSFEFWKGKPSHVDGGGLMLRNYPFIPENIVFGSEDHRIGNINAYRVLELFHRISLSVAGQRK